MLWRCNPGDAASSMVKRIPVSQYLVFIDDTVHVLPGAAKEEN